MRKSGTGSPGLAVWKDLVRPLSNDGANSFSAFWRRRPGVFFGLGVVCVKVRLKCALGGTLRRDSFIERDRAPCSLARLWVGCIFSERSNPFCAPQIDTASLETSPGNDVALYSRR